MREGEIQDRSIKPRIFQSVMKKTKHYSLKEVILNLFAPSTPSKYENQTIAQLGAAEMPMGNVTDLLHFHTGRATK